MIEAHQTTLFQKWYIACNVRSEGFISRRLLKANNKTKISRNDSTDCSKSTVPVLGIQARCYDIRINGMGIHHITLKFLLERS